MKPKASSPIQSLQWIPAERLGQYRVESGLYREVALADGRRTCVFAQTVMTDSTLCLNPWLAELGELPLDAILGDLSGVERGAYEYAWLDVEPAAAVVAGVGVPGGRVPAAAPPARGVEPLAKRALQGAEVKPAGLWARRVRIALRGAPLLIREVFLPGMGLDFHPDPR